MFKNMCATGKTPVALAGAVFYEDAGLSMPECFYQNRPIAQNFS
jgi:hypothetical protein